MVNNAGEKPLKNESVLLRSDENGIATLTLNRPNQRNALSEDLIEALQQEFDGIRDDASVRVVIIAANGRVFCAGHDIKEMQRNPGLGNYQKLFEKSSHLMMSIVRLPQPVIARVHATATAAGCQLVATCDMAVADEAAMFATPGVNIGLFCSTPMVPLSRNIGRKQSMEMLLTGRPVDAAEAARLGLINRSVPTDLLDEVINQWTSILIEKSSQTLAIGKEAFYQQIEMGLHDAYELTSKVMAHNMTIEDAEEGIAAFLEKRPAVWKGRT